jgi:hypothetical protein
LFFEKIKAELAAFEEKKQAFVTELRKEFPTITKISGHNEYANKACPGFRVSKWYNKKIPVETPKYTVTSNSKKFNFRDWLKSFFNP